MKVLVTGCNGQVGSCLVNALAKNKITTLAVDKKRLNITDKASVIALVKDYKPDIIINTAAYTMVDRAESEPELAYLINRDGPRYLAQAATEVGAAILHISTDYVFSGGSLGEYKETDETNPQGVYGASKLAGELAVQEECERHIIMRTAWVFGEHGNNFAKTMLRLGMQRDELSIVADQFGGPTYAGDIAAALIKIAEKIVSGEHIDFGVYHFSGLPHVSWFEFADAIFDIAIEKQILTRKPSLSSITTDKYPTPAKRPANSKLSTKKITQNIGISASDWKKALNNLKQYCS